MTVKDVMDKIKAVKENSELLYNLAEKGQYEDIKDYLTDSSILLDEYADVLEQMKVQRT